MLGQVATRTVAIALILFFGGGCAERRNAMKETDTFAEIEAWLALNAAPLSKLLNPPADDAAITAFENRRKVRMPPEVRRLYLIHNGESERSDGIFGCWKMLPL